jgi:hypothetical protein
MLPALSSIVEMELRSPIEGRGNGLASGLIDFVHWVKERK